MHHLLREVTSASSPLSPYTYRWPQEEVKEVVQQAQFIELVRHSGWLLKQHGNGPHPSWSRRWVHKLLAAAYIMHPAFLSTHYLPAVLSIG